MRFYSLIGLVIFGAILLIPFGKGSASLRIPFLLGFAAFLLVLALITAWILGITLFFPHGDLAQMVQDRRRLIQGHIDFLMMAQFLFIFAVLFRLYSVEPPRWMLALCCYGAFFNAFGLARAGFIATSPAATAVPPPEPSFPLPAALSFTAVTLGFVAAAALIVHAAWSAAHRSTETSMQVDPIDR